MNEDTKAKNLEDANRHAVLNLLLKGKANPNAQCYSQDNQPHPAVYVAAGERGDSLAVQYLVNNGAEFDFSTLRVAVSQGHSGIVKFLVEENKKKEGQDKIDINHLNECGENLLFDAVRNKSANKDIDVALTVNVLLEAKVSPNVKVEKGKGCADEDSTPLDVALQQHCLPVTVKVLFNATNKVE